MPDEASSRAAPLTLSAFLSPHGRMGRLGYWIGSSVAGLILIGAVFLLARASDPKAMGNDSGVVLLMLVLLVLFFWVHSLVSVKRLRDAGQPAWTFVFYVFGAMAWLVLIGSSDIPIAVAVGGSAIILVLPGFYKAEAGAVARE